MYEGVSIQKYLLIPGLTACVFVYVYIDNN